MSTPLSPFQELKTNKSVFKVSRRFFLVLNWSTNSRKGIKNLFCSRKRENKKSLWTRPRKWHAKFNQTKRRSDNWRSARVDCHIYRRRNKYLRRRHGPWKHEKEYAACNRPESCYFEKYKTELKLNIISKTYQGTYLISIATLNFQCFHLDTSFLSVLPPKR